MITVNCRHFSDGKVSGGYLDGTCAHPDQPYGSRPSASVCEKHCQHRQAIYPTLPAIIQIKNAKPVPVSLGLLKRGAAGTVRAILRSVDEQTVSARNAICKTCPHNRKMVAGMISQCAICKCAIRSKIRDPEGECPIGLWGKSPPA